MKKVGKRKINEFVTKYTNGSNIRLLILFFPLLVIFIYQIKEGTFDFNVFFDTSVLVSFLTVFSCDVIANMIIHFVECRTEDAVKLTEDYADLVNRYALEKSKMISFIDRDNKYIYLPEILLYEVEISKNNLRDMQLYFEFDHSKYNVPTQIADNSELLFNAHKHSIVYNCVNIRLNNLQIENDHVKLIYGFTTYYDSLITNRAMDYRLPCNRSIRDIYEPGPLLNDLRSSKLSNHLGFNGFVELSDGNIIFVKRNTYLSIGKGLWQQSVGASLKTKYCLNTQEEFTKDGLFHAIREEIKDELKIETTDHDMDNISVFAFYRDLVEGGKPQFLFYFKTEKYDRYSFEYHFKNDLKNNSINEKTKIDGSKFTYYTVEELRNCKYLVDCMIDSNNHRYQMTPSSIASINLFLRNI